MKTIENEKVRNMLTETVRRESLCSPITLKERYRGYDYEAEFLSARTLAMSPFVGKRFEGLLCDFASTTLRNDGYWDNVVHMIDEKGDKNDRRRKLG